jgi:flavin-dependent dehydrogenase
MFDVVIIGGSLAGAACARELTRLGLNPVALERDRFPRAKVCGGFLSPNAVECLERLEVLDEVRAAGAVDVTDACIRAAGTETEIPLRRTGLGISRKTLDEIVARNAPVRQGVQVQRVTQSDEGFTLHTDAGEFAAPVLVDAAGKLSRFTRRVRVPEFGIQHLTSGSRGSVLDFWFFEGGYGGAVSIENGCSNYSFLVRRNVLDRYTGKPGQLCTGPLAYQPESNGIIAIGDAAGMIDPFCGEGMHHALDTAVIAAQTIARGIRNKRSYVEIRQAYELERTRRWAMKRWIGETLRRAVHHPALVALGLRRNPGWFLDRLWDRIPA